MIELGITYNGLTETISKEIIEYNVDPIELFDTNMFIQEPRSASYTLDNSGDDVAYLIGLFDTAAEFLKIVAKEIPIGDDLHSITETENTNILKISIQLVIDGNIIHRGYVDKTTVEIDFKTNQVRFSTIDPLYLYKIVLEDAKIDVTPLNDNGTQFLSPYHYLKILTNPEFDENEYVVSNRKLLWETGVNDEILVDVEDIANSITLETPTHFNGQILGLNVINAIIKAFRFTPENILATNSNASSYPFNPNSGSGRYLWNWFRRFELNGEDISSFPGFQPQSIYFAESPSFQDQFGFIPTESSDNFPLTTFRYIRQFKYRQHEYDPDDPNATPSSFNYFLRTLKMTFFIERGSYYITNVNYSWVREMDTEDSFDFEDYGLLQTFTDINGDEYTINDEDNYQDEIYNNSSAPHTSVGMKIKMNGKYSIADHLFFGASTEPALDIMKLICFICNLRVYYDVSSDMIKFIKRTNRLIDFTSADYSISNDDYVLEKKRTRFYTDYYDSKPILDILVTSDINMQRLFNTIYDNIFRTNAIVLEIDIHQQLDVDQLRGNKFYNTANICDTVEYDGKNWIVMSIELLDEHSKKFILWELKEVSE